MAQYNAPDGVSFAYRESGEGPLAVFLHALLLDGRLWLDQLAGLRDIRRCVAFDMRGHGRSDPSSRSDLTKADHAADVAAFLDVVFPGEAVDLVGLAAGGEIAAMVYEAKPARVRSLTLISSNFTAQDDPQHARYREEYARLAVLEDRALLFRRYMEYNVGPATSLHVKARYRSMMEQTPYESIYTFLTHTFSAGPRPDLPGKLDLPVLVPVAESDSVVSLQGALAALPRATIVNLPAGRLAPIEAPDALNLALRRFWSEGV